MSPRPMLERPPPASLIPGGGKDQGGDQPPRCHRPQHRQCTPHRGPQSIVGSCSALLSRDSETTLRLSPPPQSTRKLPEGLQRRCWLLGLPQAIQILNSMMMRRHRSTDHRQGFVVLDLVLQGIMAFFLDLPLPLHRHCPLKMEFIAAGGGGHPPRSPWDFGGCSPRSRPLFTSHSSSSRP